MSEDQNNSDPFDFDFDELNSESPSKNTENAAFDLDNPFGDDLALSGGAAQVSADNPFLNDSASDDFSGDDSAEEFASTNAESVDEHKTEAKKKGFLGFGGGKAKPKKEKIVKPKKEKASKSKEKKETVSKESRPAVPRDLGTILCVVFFLFLLVSLLVFNIAACLTRGPESTFMQTLCFLGAFNLIGLTAAAVPLLFHKSRKEERTLPNTMLGVAAVSVLIGLQILVAEFYSYNFILAP